MQTNHRPGPSRAQAPRTGACLDSAYPSSQQGGTVLANEITDLAGHELALATIEYYRPAHCGCCGHPRPHGHGRRIRDLRGYRGLEVFLIEIRRYRCPRCKAVWTVLPGLVARGLWRAWDTFWRALTEVLARARQMIVPERTRRRWRARLRSSGRKIVAVLTTSGASSLRQRAGAVGLDASRSEVIDAWGGLTALEALSGLVHRLQPGVRVV